MKSAPPDIAVLSVAGVIATLGAAVILLVLSQISRPGDAALRLDALDRQAERLAASTGRPGDPNAYPAKAVCDASPERLDEMLRGAIAGAAKNAGVDLSSLDLAPGAPLDGPMRLTPVVVRLGARGRYDNVLSMVGHLAKLQPELFVDAVDLRSQVSTVDLKLSGRVFCSTSAPL